MGENVDVARREDEAPAELEGIFSEFDLFVSGGFRAPAGFGVIATKNVENVCAAQASGMIGETVFIDQQGERDAGVFAENPGVVTVAQADRRESRAFGMEFGLVFAQLRDVLTAENSAVVAKEHDHGGLLLPQRAEADLAAIGVGEFDGGERLA